MRLCAAVSVLLLIFTIARAIAPRPASQWSNVDWDKLESDLERGDDPDLIKSEDHVALELMNRRKDAPLEPPPGIELHDAYQHAQAATGPTMIFSALTKNQPNGLKWNKTALSALATQWQEMLHTAGIEVTTYDMEDHRMLVTLQSGWRGFEVKEFLLQQAVVTEVEWDSQKYLPPAAPSRRAAKPKKRSKPAAKKREGATTAPSRAGSAAGKGREL